MLAMIELEHPGTFESLMLIEPIIFPPPYRRMEDNPLAKLALRRRRTFTSLEAARANFARKPPFDAWDPRALDGYLACGFRREGDRWVLACTPEVEADTYRAATTHGLYGRLGELDVPTLVLAGAATTTYPLDYAAQLAARMPRGTFEAVAEATHFLPMERPGEVADRVVSLS
jgi:pimeloyl-ACP methyl ester carboxylesterase